MPTVIKRGGHREPYDRTKVRRSALLALTKRHALAAETIAEAVREHMLGRGGATDITTEEIARVMLDRLRRVDPLAALRYESALLHLTHPRQLLDLARRAARGASAR